MKCVFSGIEVLRYEIIKLVIRILYDPKPVSIYYVIYHMSIRCFNYHYFSWYNEIFSAILSLPIEEQKSVSYCELNLEG